MGVDLTIIVPCYNEEKTLPIFYSALTQVLEDIPSSCEVLFINDGSKDETLRLLKQIAGQDERIFYLNFSRNFGKEAAMYAGLCHARGNYVVIMDVDMQDPPELLPKMMEQIQEEGVDCVATRRVSRSGEPMIRSWFARLFYRVINGISETEIVDGARDYRLMKRVMVEAIIAMDENNRFSKGIFGWVGFRTKWLSYENVDRSAGSSKWSFWKLFRYALDGIISFSQLPLSIASWIGFLMTFSSALVLIFVVLRRLLFGDPVAGWASLICTIIFIGGIQLFCMGVMGQYIAKMYVETKRRPHYIASESNLKDFIRVK